MASLAQNPKLVSEQFRAHWQSSTADSNLTLHGFCRFKTTHLLNLRFLESEIAELDHIIFQAGLSLGLSPSPEDRLGLKHGKRDKKALGLETVDHGFILKLRDLLQQYDEALAAFNTIMSMETFSLLDDEKQSILRNDLNLFEIYKTRLVRVDLGPRSRQDPLQRRLHRYLRAFRYWRLTRRGQNDGEDLGTFTGGDGWSYQNTVFIAEVVGRFLTATITGVFLIVPQSILSYQSSKEVHLAVISVCIVFFTCLVSALLKVSNLEMMMVSAAYGAVLSVFVSNAPQA